ncbi:MAG: DUF3874 domain-containing protein [Bacteroides sp]|nr:DUF3874 domain-containing protein [Bacteroides sp.]
MFPFAEGRRRGHTTFPTEIFCRLQKKYLAAFRSSNVVNMCRLLVGLRVERLRTRHGSAYRVVPM